MALRRPLITAILMLLAGAATAQLTSEAPLSPPQYGPAPSDQDSPVVASDGTDFLVAWFDARAMPASIYANRVTRNGQVLDGTGIRVPMEPDSGNAVMVGLFHIDGAYTLIYSYELFNPSSYRTAAAIISDDGGLIDGPRVILDDSAARVGASNGSRIVLFDEYDIVVLDGHANVMDRFHAPAGPASGLSIASNGSTFLLVTFTYDGVNRVNLIALDADGQPTDVTQSYVSASGNGPIIGSDGADYLVLYNDATSSNAVAQSVTAHAEIRTTSALDIGPFSVSSTTLLWTGSTYILATKTENTEHEITVLNVDRTGGSPRNSRSLGAGAPEFSDQPSIAWNGSEGLLAWTSGSQEAPDGMEIEGALLSANGTSLSSPVTIPESSNVQVEPVIATSGSQDLVAWVETTGIYASRITIDGVALDGRGIPVDAQAGSSRSLTLADVETLRVIFDGASYLVAWGGFGGVKGQRIDPGTGSLLGEAVPLADCVTSFDLANDSISPVIFATDCSSGQVYAQRVGIAGAVGPVVAISPAGMFTGAPRVVWSGHEWLVAWNELIQLPLDLIIYRGNVYAARLDGSLTVLDAQPIPIAVSDFDETTPLVASDGEDFVVLWSHLSYDAAAGVYLRRVHSDGSMAETSPVVKGGYEVRSVVWNGLGYSLAYANDAAYWNHDLFLTHIAGRDGEALIHDQVAISASDSDEQYASLAAHPGGPLRIVYTRVANELQYGGVSRVFMRDEISPSRRRSVRVH